MLEAWYTSIEDYGRDINTSQKHESLKLKTENDSELNQVYVYSSPKHNGVYEPTASTMNHSIFDNVSVNETFDFNDTLFFNDSLLYLNDSVDMTVEFVNASDGCNGVSFARSYASWREGDKRHHGLIRNSSVSLRAPLTYR